MSTNKPCPRSDDRRATTTMSSTHNPTKSMMYKSMYFINSDKLMVNIVKWERLGECCTTSAVL